VAFYNPQEDSPAQEGAEGRRKALVKEASEQAAPTATTRRGDIFGEVYCVERRRSNRLRTINRPV